MQLTDKLVVYILIIVANVEAFVANNGPTYNSAMKSSQLHMQQPSEDFSPRIEVGKLIGSAALLASTIFFQMPAGAEDELAAKYGGGFDASLVDQTCLVDRCSVQAKECLADDPSCRKGLTCTAKCLGDNSCITGCMARYGNKHLDNLLKCTIEDNECIKVAILPGGADKYGEEPRSPAPTIKRFDPSGMQGSWYKVLGFNPNYDCYACQRNTFSPTSNSMFAPKDKLAVDVEFSMPHMLPDGSPLPPRGEREVVNVNDDDGLVYGSHPIGFNDYSTHEVMVFDKEGNAPTLNLADGEESYTRTAHSEGEMFGLKFWENWYVIGENDPGTDEEFKFVYYNGKTRQNTYSGAFVYSRTRELSGDSLKKIYSIAKSADLNPDQFCKIRNGCFTDDTVVTEPTSGLGSPSNPFRGILASTKVSQLLGVEPVAAEQVSKRTPTSPDLQPPQESRAWWHEVGDYLENPHRHYEAIDSVRITMDWPEEAKTQ